MPKSTTTTKDAVPVDFSDTESRGGKKGGSRKHYPPADYAVKCVRATLGHSGEKETPRIEATYRFTRGKLKGKEIRDDLYLTPKSLWRLRQTLEAMGLNVPSKKTNLRPASMVGKELAVSVDDDEYDGKVYSKVVDAFLLSELEEVDDEAEDEEDEEGEAEDEDEEADDEDDEEEESAEEDDDEDLDEIDL